MFAAARSVARARAAGARAAASMARGLGGGAAGVQLAAPVSTQMVDLTKFTNELTP